MLELLRIAQLLYIIITLPIMLALRLADALFSLGLLLTGLLSTVFHYPVDYLRDRMIARSYPESRCKHCGTAIFECEGHWATGNGVLWCSREERRMHEPREATQ